MLAFGEGIHAVFLLGLSSNDLRRYLAKANALIETGMKACDNGPPVPPKDLEADMEDEIQVALFCFFFAHFSSAVVVAAALCCVLLYSQRRS